MPASMTRSTPNRWMMEPVTKDGANMASTCHWMTSAASPRANPQPTMASGVAVMTRLITP